MNRRTSNLLCQVTTLGFFAGWNNGQCLSHTDRRVYHIKWKCIGSDSGWRFLALEDVLDKCVDFASVLP